MSGLFSCCGKRDKSSAQEKSNPNKKYPAVEYEHFSRPDWGIQDILVPQDSCIRRLQNGALIGDLSNPKGTFKIEPQLNKMARENYGARLEVYITFFKEDWDNTLRADLELPEDAFFTFTETNIENWGVLHHATFRAPFPDNRHGLTITFDIPQNEEEALIRAKPVIQKMLSSMKWVERNTVCTPAANKVVGSWLHVHEQAATKQSPHKMTIIKKIKFFEEGHWGFWQWELKASVDIKPEDVNENDHPLSDFGTGDYMAYEHDGKLHLYLVNMNRISPLQIETITVVGDKEKLIRQGGDEYKCLEKGQPFRPTIEEAWGIKLKDLDEEDELDKDAEGKDVEKHEGDPKISEEEADGTTSPEGKVSPIDEKQQPKVGDA